MEKWADLVESAPNKEIIDTVLKIKESVPPSDFLKYLNDNERWLAKDRLINLLFQVIGFVEYYPGY